MNFAKKTKSNIMNFAKKTKTKLSRNDKNL